MAKDLISYTSIGNYNNLLSTVSQGAITDENYSEKTQSTAVAQIRNTLPFSDIVFSFPVTQRDVKIRLPAFLTSHSDSFSPQWNPTTVYGRADPIPIYKNTTRSISLNFKIPNQSLDDANANFKSLGVLVRNLYPLYKSFGSSDVVGAIRDVLSGLAPNQSIVGAPLTRIKFANLICNSDNPAMGLLGYIQSFSVSMETSAGYFILADGTESLLFPRMLNFSLTFSPLHEHKLGWATSNNWLGQFRNNYPYQVKKEEGVDPNMQSVNVLGAIISGDTSAGVRAFFRDK